MPSIGLYINYREMYPCTALPSWPMEQAMAQTSIMSATRMPRDLCRCWDEIVRAAPPKAGQSRRRNAKGSHRTLQLFIDLLRSRVELPEAQLVEHEGRRVGSWVNYVLSAHARPDPDNYPIREDIYRLLLEVWGRRIYT